MLIKKGAEANIHLGEWNGRKVIEKKRITKEYRLKEIDTALRSYRTAHEAQIIHEAKKAGVPTPIIYQVDRSASTIIMERVEGERLKELLPRLSAKARRKLCRLVGQNIARMHQRDIIHGDLTTSNMILLENGEVCLIDFGLSYFSDELEDRGVDLHLIKRALNSAHYRVAESCFAEIKGGYVSLTGRRQAEEVFKKVNEIEKRGRYSERM